MDWKFSFVALTRRHVLGDGGGLDGGAANAREAVRDGERGGLGPETRAASADGAEGGGETGVVNWGRVMRYPMKRSRHVILDLCNAHGSIERRVVSLWACGCCCACGTAHGVCVCVCVCVCVFECVFLCLLWYRVKRVEWGTFSRTGNNNTLSSCS